MSHDDGNGSDYERGRRAGERRADKRVKAYIAAFLGSLVLIYGLFKIYLQVFEPENPFAPETESGKEFVMLVVGGLLAYLGVDTLTGRK